MVVSIPLPGRKNAKGVDLSVSATELNLEGVPGYEPLHVQLPVRNLHLRFGFTVLVREKQCHVRCMLLRRSLDLVGAARALSENMQAIVDTQDVRAKFDKSQATLRVTLQVSESFAPTHPFT